MGAAAAPRRVPAAPARRAPARRKPARRASTGAGAAARRAPAKRSGAPRSARATAQRARTSGAAKPRLAPRNGFAQPALAGAALIPHAAVRTAGAVRDLSDSSLIMRLTRGRGWIAVLCALLVGIVALNVVSLSLNAGSGRLEQQISELERANSGLRAEVAQELSSSRIAQLAPGLGYYVPDPEDVGYLKARDADLDKLLKLFSNEMVMGRAAPVDTTSSADVSYEEPAAIPAPVEEASTVPEAPTAPVTPAPAPVAPPTPAPTPAPSSSTGATGGVGL
jgi:hypothetical protein